MTLDLFGTLAEIIAAITVIISLIYLARQIRQQTETFEAATELESSRMLTDLHSRVAYSPDMARIWDIGMGEPEELGEEEKRRFVWLLAEFFFTFEAIFQQWQRGFVSDSTWRQHEAAAVGMLRNPVAQEWWKSGVSPFTMEFIRHVDGVASAQYEGAWQYTPLAKL